MRGIDLTTFDFDYDLTFAVLILHADGTILHTYAGRDATDPQSHLSFTSLATTLSMGLASNRAHQLRLGKRAPPRTVEDLPLYEERIGVKKPTCVHCHMVHDVMTYAEQAKPRFDIAAVWRWPDPIEVGLRLARDRQTVVREVTPHSPAARAGLRKGDRLVSVGGVPVHTFGDVQRQIRAAPAGAHTLAIERARADRAHGGQAGGDQLRVVRLRVPKGWRRPTPEVFAWRPSKWPLSPAPGFGGKSLPPEAREAAGVVEAPWAMRVNYLVTWGDQSHRGRNAAQAGLRKGDLVLSVHGKDDFESTEHFHAWFRLTRKVGEQVALVIVRKGERKELRMKVVR